MEKIQLYKVFIILVYIYYLHLTHAPWHTAHSRALLFYSQSYYYFVLRSAMLSNVERGKADIRYI